MGRTSNIAIPICVFLCSSVCFSALSGMLAFSVLRANGHSMCLAGALDRDLCDRNRPHLLDPGMLGSCVLFLCF